MSTPPAEATRPGFLRHVLNYGAVSVIQKAVSVAMLPLYTRWLVEAEYGVVALTDLVLIVLAELFGRHLLAGMSRIYFVRPEGAGRRAVISSTTLVVVAVAWAVSLAALLFVDRLAPVLLGEGDAQVGPQRLEHLLTLTLLVLPCHLTSQAGFAYLQITKRSQLFAGIQLVKMALELTLKIVLIGVLGWGVEGFLVSVLIGEGLAAVALTGGVLHRVGLRVERAVLEPVLRFAMPLVPVGVFQLGLHQLDRRLVEHLAPGDRGLTWAGIYGLGYLIGTTPIAVFLNAVFGIWQPTIFGIKDRADRGRAIARGLSLALVAAAALCAVTALLGRPLVDLLAGREGYRAAHRVVPWITCGYAFWTLYVCLQLAFYAEQRTRDLVAINLAALLANIALNLALVPRFGYVGAAAATLLTFALLAGIAAVVARRACPTPLVTARAVVALFASFAFAAAALCVAHVEEGWPALAALGLRVLVLAIALLTCWFGLLSAGQRSEFRAHLARIRTGRGIEPPISPGKAP